MIPNRNVILGTLIMQPEQSVRSKNSEVAGLAVQRTAGHITVDSVVQIKQQRLGHTITETAELLNISTRSVHRLLKRGLLRSSKALRKIIVPRTEIEKFLLDTTEII